MPDDDEELDDDEGGDETEEVSAAEAPAAAPDPRSPCSALKKDGQPCKARRVPGESFCMAHLREEKRRARTAQSRAGGIETALHADEKGLFDQLFADLSAQVRPKGIADTISINRLAMAYVRASRLDSAARAGNASAIKGLYFADLTIQHWLTKLGLDRRFRMKAEDASTRKEKDLRRVSALLGGGGGKMDLERPAAPPPEEEAPAGTAAADPVHGVAAANGHVPPPPPVPVRDGPPLGEDLVEDAGE
jgi:hypothetical protein